jgi:outer membrane beta-barrel protein
MLLALALVPVPALGQAGMGLDLSGDQPPKDDKSDVTPLPPPPATPADLDLPKKSDAPRLSEAQIASEDRVKSVQRKPFLKRSRVEVTPMGFATLNDAYYPKAGPGARLSFFFHDSFGLALRGFQYNLIATDNVRLAKRQLQSKLPKVQPKVGAFLDLLWSPIYGKVSLFNSIKHFDLYLVGGAGMELTQTSDVDGPHFSTHIGLGQRFAVTDWLAVDLSVLDTLYADRPDGGGKSVLQQQVSINGGLSFYLPLSFDYKEP